MSKNNNIEDIFKQAFDGYKVNPSPKLWGSIRSKFLTKQFLQFGFSSFNIYYIGAVLVGSTITYSAIKYSNQNPDIEATNVSEKWMTQNVQNDNALTENNSKKSIHIGNSITANSKNQISAENNEQNKNQKTGDQAVNSLTSTISDTSGSSTDLNVEDTASYNSNAKKELPDKPLAKFILNKKLGCGKLEVSFKNISKLAKSYEWDFGDGNGTDEKDPAHIYYAGHYKVTLKIKGTDNKYYTYSDNITVHESPEAIFEIDEFSSNIESKTVYFTNYTKNGINYLWDFGDGQNSTEFEPIHNYENNSTYLVKLKVWSDKGCIDSTTIKNSILNLNYFIAFPSAFTPSVSGPRRGYYAPGGNTDEIFYPEYKGIAEYKLQIFSRTGILMFETTDIDYGWNGYYKGRIANMGVYIWEASGKFYNGESFFKSGTVTIIHKN